MFLEDFSWILSAIFLCQNPHKKALAKYSQIHSQATQI